MLFLKSWLEDYIDLSGISDKNLIETITLKSSEVEEVREIQDYFDGKVVVGRIENLRKHTDADKLNVFDVVIGKEKKVQIVSAAQNVREGLYIPVALEGARLPGVVIAPRKMRGIDSQGMCCGMSELMLETEYSSGLWELNDLVTEENLGKSICEVLPQFFPVETIFDIKVLPNRVGVIGSYMGMAREIVLCLGKSSLLKKPIKRLEDGEKFLDQVVEEIAFEQKPESLSVSFRDETEITNSFSLFDASMDTNGEYCLPHEMKKRMFLTNINMVGGLADLSNYLLQDIGQPTHFFSKNKIIEVEGTTPDWTVRRLDTPQEFTGLGQLKKTILPVNTPVLSNKNGEILAIPGVSGGEKTKLDSHENNVIIEIANFSAEDIARTSFALKYRSDGGKIWAGGVNQQLVFVTLLRLREILGSSLHISPILFWSKRSGVIESLPDFTREFLPRSIEIDLDYLASRLDGRGIGYWKSILEEKLNLIGDFDGKNLVVETFYSNLQTIDDVFEELIRFIGLENLEPQDLILNTNISQTGIHNARRKLKDIFVDFGFDEVITRPFVGELLVSNNAKTPKVLKPYRSHEPFVRDNLFYSLLDCVGKNMKEGVKQPKIFELNSFFTIDDGLVKEEKELQAIYVGEDPYLLTSVAREVWNKTSRKHVAEYKDLGIAQNIGRGFWYETHEKNEPWISVSEVSNSVKKKFEIPLNKKVWSINLLLSYWDGTYFDHKRYKDESMFPITKRSYTVVLDKSRMWSEVVQVVQAVPTRDFEIVVSPIERFEKGEKDTLTFEVQYISYSKTLTKEEIEEFEKKMIQELDHAG